MGKREEMGKAGLGMGQRPCREKEQGQRIKEMLQRRHCEAGRKPRIFQTQTTKHNTAVERGSLSPFPTHNPALPGSLGEGRVEVLLHLLQCTKFQLGWP